MKNIAKTLLIVLAIIAFACKQNGNNATSSTADTTVANVQTKEEIAYNEVLEVHDSVMPKMGKLIGYQKRAKQSSDSITQLLKAKNILGAKVYKQQVDSLLIALQLAEKGMNDWMQAFNAEPNLPTTEERTAYFIDQKQKALNMKGQFFGALNKATQLFGE
jgi:GTP-sensing pleiotropic transcriptional regulator CodY